MGFFSWETSDTKRSIANLYSPRKTFPVHVLCPNGTVITELNYEGYGRFGGRDIYALVAIWNTPERCKDDKGEWLPDDEIRSYGIDIACYNDQNKNLKYPIKFVEDKTLKYEEVEPSLSCRYQGFFYDEDEEYEIE